MDKLQQFKTHYAEAVKSFNEKMSYEELKTAIQTLINFVKTQKELTAQELEAIKIMLKSATAKMSSDQSAEMEMMKKQAASYCEKEMNKMYFEHESMMSAMDAKMDEVKPLEPIDTDLLAKQASDLAITSVLAKLPAPYDLSKELPSQGDLIADAVSGLLEVKDIKNLQEILDELKQLRTQRLGGGTNYMGISQHFIDAETPTEVPNGVITDFTLVNTPNPETSLKVFADGQRLKLTTDYTLSGKTVSFVTAPITDVLIIFEYRN